MINLIHGDCNKYLAGCKDKQYSLSICDPPYGIGIGTSVGGGKPFGNNRKGKSIEPKVYRGFNDSKTPEKKYFEELIRTSNNQMIFGGNYFIEHLKNTPCMIVWDKDNSGNFADAELIWTSFSTSVRIFQYRWNGMLQQNMKDKEDRIHPTQKPVQLYKWLLKNYAKEGDSILDTHLGSGSSAIACIDGGFDFTGIELDPDYFEAMVKRVENHVRQLDMFIERPEIKIIEL